MGDVEALSHHQGQNRCSHTLLTTSKAPPNRVPVAASHSSFVPVSLRGSSEKTVASIATTRCASRRHSQKKELWRNEWQAARLHACEGLACPANRPCRGAITIGPITSRLAAADRGARLKWPTWRVRTRSKRAVSVPAPCPIPVEGGIHIPRAPLSIDPPHAYVITTAPQSNPRTLVRDRRMIRTKNLDNMIGISMTTLSLREVKTEESGRLGIKSGWYGTKVSGTFVTGPHATSEACARKIAEIGPLLQDRRISIL
jgi:hypothetical protein